MGFFIEENGQPGDSKSAVNASRSVGRKACEERKDRMGRRTIDEGERKFHE